MPTNLPPDYFEIEKRFRDAETVEERISLLTAPFVLRCVRPHFRRPLPAESRRGRGGSSFL